MKTVKASLIICATLAILGGGVALYNNSDFTRLSRLIIEVDTAALTSDFIASLPLLTVVAIIAVVSIVIASFIRSGNKTKG